jgi:endonuclease/exonuclease/phosphatase family metal-dependent hydrolase
MNEFLKRARASARALIYIGVVVCGLSALWSCLPGGGLEPEVESVRDVKVMTYNVHQYCLMDRDGDGQDNDPKPAKERNAVVSVIRDENPDILVVQEMGDETVFQEFVHALAEAGLEYPYTDYLRRGRSNIAMALLSRYPILVSRPRTDDVYSIGEAKLPVLRGFMDVEIELNTNYVLRILAAHLKAKVFHRMGQTEMRRNEARLLNKHVRKAINANTNINLMVVGDINDTYQSAALREVLGKRKRVLFDLRPEDEWGDVWTHYSSEDDSYGRIDYILVNQGMLDEINRDKTRAVRHKLQHDASDHRPLVAVITPVNGTQASEALGDEEE